MEKWSAGVVGADLETFVGFISPQAALPTSKLSLEVHRAN